MVKLRKSITAMVLAGALSVVGMQGAWAQAGFPDKPISIHVGFPVCTANDSVCRALGVERGVGEFTKRKKKN